MFERVAGAAASVILRHKIRAIVAIGVLLVMTGGTVTAYEGEGGDAASPEYDQRISDSVIETVNAGTISQIGPRNGGNARQLGAQGQQESTDIPSIEGTSIDRIEVYVHINERYPSLHRVPQVELDKKEGYSQHNYTCSGSMLPTLSCADTGYSVSAEDETVPLAVDDIVAYHVDDELADCFALQGWHGLESGDLIMHRIIEIVDEAYRLQGDNNNAPEPCLIPRKNIKEILVGLRRPIDLDAISVTHMREVVTLYFSGNG